MKKSTIYLPAILILLNFSCSKKDAEEPARKAISFKAATYNVHYFAGSVGSIAETIKRINPQVIALQEVKVFGRKDLSKIIARRLKYYHTSSYPYVSFGKTKWVLAFLSRYPIIKSDQIKLGYYRRALRIFIKIEDIDISLITLHLTPFVMTKKDPISANRKRSRIRKLEIADLIKWLDKRKYPTIIMGDFNSIPLMGELAPLYKIGFRNADHLTGRSVKGTYRVKEGILAKAEKILSGFPIPKKITLDYILLSEKIAAETTETYRSDASDHLPLVSKLIINKDISPP